ncbi:MAG: hypothetical protein SV377_03660 [Halobacteria archaeon]|nr:hypothetical protein [Halobacteria archaeon]
MSLLRWMIREEWRLHSRLFGGWRFGVFPLIILGMSALIYASLLYSGFTVKGIEVGLHYAMFFFGLNVGSVGFVSRDAFENLLGEANLLIFSSRTLPLSERRILSAFLVKDLLYYSVLYLVPIVVALVPVSLYLGASVSAYSVPLLWFTSTGSFMLGVGLSFLASVLYLRSRLILLASAVAFGVVIAYFRFRLLVFTPLGFFREPSLLSLLRGFVPIVLISVIGIVAFRPSPRATTRTHTARFSNLNSTLPFDRNGVVTKILLDINRSSGDVWKILFSVGILFAVFVFMVQEIDFVSAIISSPGISFAVLLSIASISVYNWINTFDNPETYFVLPLDTRDVFEAKFRVYLLISIPVSYAYLALVGLFLGFVDVLIGFVILPLLSVYVFGVTAYITGLDPDELLLDSKLFAAFTVVIAIGSFAYSEFPAYVTVFTLVYSAVAGLVGYVAYRRTPAKWDRRIRG